MRYGIVGGGVAGMTAAYELAKRGHQVTVYEAASRVGGLASGFKASHWDWSLERFYHHLFQTDDAMLGLVDEIGFRDKLFFRSPVTAHWSHGTLYPVDSPLNLLRFPAMPFADRVRLGAAVAYLKYVTSDWHKLEQQTAVAWCRRYAGNAAYDTFLGPLLEGKFGPHTPQVNMAWLWARFRARSFQLGYFVGGFQAFADYLRQVLERMGVTIRLQSPVRHLTPPATASAPWALHTADDCREYDRVVITSSPRLLAKLVPSLPDDYLAGLHRLQSLGAVVMVLALKYKLTDHFYWMQGMDKREVPFLALVEHTNFIDRQHYGGDNLVYCGDYLPADHAYFQMSEDELLAHFLPALRHFNPNFTPDWVQATWLHREAYAQPVVGLNHSAVIPPLATPLHGLYWASMSQVYPWDRGTNFAVELGQRVAAEAAA